MNLNTKKAKKELSNLIFNIATCKANTDRYYRGGDYSEAQKAWGYYNLCRYQVLIIELKEKFDLDFYLPEDVQTLVDAKQAHEADAKASFLNWREAEEAEEKTKAVA